MILTNKFFEVLKHEGVVSIVSWSNNEANVTNTWNSYLVIEDDKILIPAAGMHTTEEDVKVNPKIKLTLGSREVEGYNNYQGTGFLVEGTAKFVYEGDTFEKMKKKYSFISRVLEIKVTSCTQRL